MKSRVQELIGIGDKLYADGFPLLALWQTLAENFYPMRADMTRVRYIPEEFASYLMTGVGRWHAAGSPNHRALAFLKLASIRRRTPACPPDMRR
jgi:hypothetical protein